MRHRKLLQSGTWNYDKIMILKAQQEKSVEHETAGKKKPDTPTNKPLQGKPLHQNKYTKKKEHLDGVFTAHAHRFIHAYIHMYIEKQGCQMWRFVAKIGGVSTDLATKFFIGENYSGGQFLFCEFRFNIAFYSNEVYQKLYVCTCFLCFPAV